MRRAYWNGNNVQQMNQVLVGENAKVIYGGISNSNESPTIRYHYINDYGWKNYTFVAVSVPIIQPNEDCWFVNPNTVSTGGIIMGRVIGRFVHDVDESTSENEKKIEKIESKNSSPMISRSNSFASSFAEYCERRDEWDWADWPRPERVGNDYFDFDSDSRIRERRKSWIGCPETKSQEDWLLEMLSVYTVDS